MGKKISQQFINQIKIIVPDWETRKTLISKGYADQKKYITDKKELNNLWNRLVIRELPQGINLGDWKSFVSAITTHHAKNIQGYSKQQASTKTIIIVFVEKKLDVLEDALQRVRNELKSLGGGDENMGEVFLNNYLYE